MNREHAKKALFMCLAILAGWTALCLTSQIPVWYSDRELSTVGRITHYGLPLPWIDRAEGYSIPYTLGHARFGFMTINLAFWTLLGCLAFRVTSKTHIVICILIALLPLLPLFLA